MKYTVRTFIAVEIDDAVRRRVVELIGAYAATAAKVSWVQRQNLHLTLKFLDEVPLGSIPEVSAAVEKAAAAFHPFDLEICAAGAFPFGAPATVRYGWELAMAAILGGAARGLGKRF